MLHSEGDYNVVVPCRDMLIKTLKLDQVHTFGDFSKSQLIEKIDLIAEKTHLNDLKRVKTIQPSTFITIISLAFSGLLVETEIKHKKRYEK